MQNPISSINRKVLLLAMGALSIFGITIFLLILTITSPQKGFNRARLTTVRCTVEDIDIQQDNKYLFVGTCLKQEPVPFELSYAGFLIRTHEDLTIDTSFGDGGRVFFLSSKASFTLRTVGSDKLGDDSIWVAGSLARKDSKRALQAFIGKFDRNGIIEKKFGNRSGIYLFDKSSAYSVTIEDSVIQNDHSFVVAGWQIGAEQKVVTFLKKVYSDGTEVQHFPLENSMTDGKFNAIGRMPNGLDFLLTGESNDDILVMEFTEDGRPIKDFGKEGRLIIDIKGKDSGLSVATQQKSLILVGGISDYKVVNRSRSGEGFILGIQNNGTVSNHFGVNGLDFVEGYDSGLSQVNAIRIDQDGSFYTLGSKISKGKKQSIFIRLYTPFGHLNKSFGNAGEFLVPGINEIHASLLTPSALVLGGQHLNQQMLTDVFMKNDSKLISYPPVIPIDLSFHARIPEAVEGLFTDGID
jgi:hypothetical protein